MTKFYAGATSTDYTVLAGDNRRPLVFTFVLTTIYDINTVYGLGSKLVGMHIHETGYARTVLSNNKEHQAFMGALPQYKNCRVISRGDMKRELQKALADKAMAYMDRVLSGKDTYDDD